MRTLCDFMRQCSIPQFIYNHKLVCRLSKYGIPFLLPCAPFLNPNEEFLAAWRWKVYNHQPHGQISLLDAMCAGCRYIAAKDCQLTRHAKHFYPRCIASDDIGYDVYENVAKCWRSLYYNNYNRTAFLCCFFLSH